MSKLRFSYNAYWFDCPGCNIPHAFFISHWNVIDAETNHPSASPSLKNTGGEIDCCHLTLLDGILHFYTDCTHYLAGQKVPL